VRAADNTEHLVSVEPVQDVIRNAAQTAQAAVSNAPVEEYSRLSIFHGYTPVFVIAFLVTLCATPIMRRLAVANGIIDRPSVERKVHRMPIAYLGGVAVYLGLMSGILFSYLGIRFPSLMEVHRIPDLKHVTDEGFAFGVPPSVLLGLTVIMVIGLIDDVMGISPRVKVGGQLLAAAALAVDNVGVKMAAGALIPLAKSLGIPVTMYHDLETIMVHIPLPVAVAGMNSIPIDFIYWIGTAIIAISVLGLCNASNLIDGLDGLLTGVTSIAAGGLLVLALGLAFMDDGPRDAQRIVLCMALLGACLGFLPHNFNPATIFLGDAGSLLLGFTTCVIILTMGDTGKTQLVAAGLIIYAVPIIDTSLAIVRRKMSGRPISAADDQHLHHMLKRAIGVKGGVLVLYGMGVAFAVLGVLVSLVRARSVYVITLLLAAYIGVTAIKIARRKHIEEQAAEFDARRTRGGELGLAGGDVREGGESKGNAAQATGPTAATNVA
jgi:UDP-GlcNAc:undecaprenyl-phosphate GlcNAc-1-phosphate transferase